MLKKLTILAIAVLIVSVYAHGQTHKAGRPQTDQNPARHTAASVVQQPSSTERTPEDQQKIKADVNVIAFPRKDWQDKAIFWVNLALAIVGFFGVGIGIATVLYIRKQTTILEDSVKVAKDGAEAALLNAQAVVNAERGKILLRVEKQPLPNAPGKACFSIKAANRGRTAVQVLTFGTPTEMATASPKGLPVPPVYPTGPDTDDGSYMTVDCPAVEVCRFTPASSENMARRVASQQREGGRLEDQKILIYGEIRYRDGISSEPRYCRYCFRFDNSEFSNIGGRLVADGPPEYSDGS